MFILIDIGNTYGKFTLVDLNCSLIKSNRIVSDQIVGNLDLLTKIINDFLQLAGKENVQAAVASSVKKDLQEVLINFFESIDFPFLLISKITDYLNSSCKEVGADLTAAAIGALAIYNRDVIIFNSGTATTVSLVKYDYQNNKMGTFLGGLIMPGINSGIMGLTSATKLPHPWLGNKNYLSCLIERDEMSNDVNYYKYGTNTIDAMMLGSYYNFIATMKELSKNMSSYFDSKPLIILTGGVCSMIREQDKKIFDVIEPSLVTKGLFYLAISISS